jgi:hypothetical protein
MTVALFLLPRLRAGYVDHHDSTVIINGISYGRFGYQASIPSICSFFRRRYMTSRATWRIHCL